jgi:hypothetical protein
MSKMSVPPEQETISSMIHAITGQPAMWGRELWNCSSNAEFARASLYATRTRRGPVSGIGRMFRQAIWPMRRRSWPRFKVRIPCSCSIQVLPLPRSMPWLPVRPEPLVCGTL